MPPPQAFSILVVDDDPDVVETTVTLLDLHGYRAAGATGGGEALAAAAADPPAVALVDLGMPGVDGFQLARRLKDLPAAPLLVAVTGRTSDADRERAGRAGFAAYLVKPVPPAELLDLVRLCEQARSWD
ncbi:MAG TPA: response regulator [Gemmata sp.]|nr:response regulator [Gemmata sp.]